jgi:hypothetical protein
MAIKLDVGKVIGNMKKLDHTIPLVAAAALYQEALVEQKKSMKRTPVDTGALRDSHQTSAPKWKGQNLEVTIKVGGPAAGYAVIVHEDMEAIHPVGQAKFLESTILESAPFLLARIAKRMKLNQGMV